MHAHPPDLTLFCSAAASVSWLDCCSLPSNCLSQVPDDIVFVEEIPHNATGKVSKLTLRQMFKDYKPAQAKL